MEKIDLRNITNSLLRHIFQEALFFSYNHTCQIFSKNKGYNRDKTNKSYTEIVDAVLSDKYKLVTIIHRNIINENYDLEHWELGMCTNELYLNICVRPDLAEKIFKEYNLTQSM